MSTSRLVTDAVAEAARAGRPLVVCDVSPPRGPVVEHLDEIRAIPAEFLCVAYAPGRAVRLDSLAMAVMLRQRTGHDTVFNLATRDMNRLALSNHLLGAHALDVPNVVIVRGDDLSERDQGRISPVQDTTPTRLLRDVINLNQGRDLRDAVLHTPTRLCAGATLDLARGIDAEARLVLRKVRAGAAFLLAQPITHPADAHRFLAAYRQHAGESLSVPVLWGVAVLATDSVAFGEVPASWRRDLADGRPGAEIAAEHLRDCIAEGLTTVYLMPPILRGGVRRYPAATEALQLALGRPARSTQ